MKKIFEEVRLKSGHTLKNRIAMAPMTTTTAFYDGRVTQELIDYYSSRAGDAGLIIVESAFVEGKGRGFPGAIGIDKDDKIPGLSLLAKAIKSKGSKAVIQIYHAGRMAWPELNGGATPISASPVAALRPNAPTPTEMTDEEVVAMIQLFGDAARRAILAGFDGVEIHGANTFLIQQFFSPHSNRRHDRWGGTREKNARFSEVMVEMVQSVAAAENKDDFIIGYRFSPEEMEQPGIHFEDTMYLLNQLAEYDLDYFHFSMGSYLRGSIVNSDDPDTLIRKYMALRSPKLAATPIMGVGGILQREDAENALKEGYDLLAVGKGFLVNPDYVSAVQHGKKVNEFAHISKREELSIPSPLWNYMDEAFNLVKDPEEEKRRLAQIKALQNKAVSFKPGTYKVEASGHGGSLPLDISFSENKIDQIFVDRSGESEGLSDQVFQRLPQQIVDSQTLNVDAISGASESSRGLLEGVAKAVELAGGHEAVEIFKARPKPKVEWSNEHVTEEVDLVVVGGGAAGLATALRADELGYSVVLLEKMSYIGGAISVSGGNQVVSGSKLQKQAGVDNDSPESLIEDFMKNGDYKNDPQLLSLLAHHLGEATDWVNEYMNVQYDMEDGLHVLAEYKVNRELAYKKGGPGFASAVRNCIENSGVKVYYQTKAEQLITDDTGAVVGVEAIQETGRRYTLHAKSVVITTGGYGNNKAYLKEELKGILFYGTQSATGDGLKIALDVGAATQNMEYGKVYPNGIEVSSVHSKSTIGGNIAVLKRNGILVNKEGNRVINERASNREILDVLMEQDPKMLYILLDRSHFELFSEEVEEGGISKNDIQRWLESNGANSPQFYHADTLVELAELAGMDPAALEMTVGKFNQAVANGVDPEFKRPSEYLQIFVGEGPYYLIEQKPRFATTLGGLQVNDKLEVQDKDGKPIPGLYAAGEVVGGVMGTDSPSGANNAWALTSGKLSAENIADALQGILDTKKQLQNN